MVTSKEALKMRKWMCAFACLVIALTYAFPVFASTYDTVPWAHKIAITVNNPGATTLNDYPVRINVLAKTFIDAGMMTSNLADIRFSDGTNALPFWISVTKNMIRYINNIPVWVKLKTFSPGNNTIYMYYDTTKHENDYPPLVNYTAGTANDSADYCGENAACSNYLETTSAACTSPAVWSSTASTYFTSSAPYSGVNCGKNVFEYSTSASTTSTYTGIFSYDCTDNSTTATGSAWPNPYCTGSGCNCTSANALWVSSQPVGDDPSSSPSNAFDLSFELHYSSGNSGAVYFLTQNGSTQPTAKNLDSSYTGYKLGITYGSTSTANQTYNMDTDTLTLYKSTSAGTWTSVMSTTWNPYNNTIQAFDIEVTPTTIKILINGQQVGTTYTRTDSWKGGYVGFNRGGFSGGPNDSSNSTDSISPIWVIDKFPGSMPAVTLYGEADLEIERLNPTNDNGTWTGLNVIEAYPQTQVLNDYVYGNTLEKYVYSAFPLASLPSQVFEFAVTLRNRGSATDTFTLTPTLVGNTSTWSIAYNAGAGMVYMPQGTSNPGAYTTTLSAGGSLVITYYVMPSSEALFEGAAGSNNMTINFKLTGKEDQSFDNVRYVANLIGESGCYWQYKLPITISYDDINGTGNLVNYQVLVNVSGIGQLSSALPNGSDIIFTDVNGAYIPFWIKTTPSGTTTLNTSGGSGSFWVQVPTIASGGVGTTTPTTIYMWWGNSSYTTSLSSESNTFDMYENWQLMDTVHSWTVGTAVGCPLLAQYCSVTTTQSCTTNANCPVNEVCITDPLWTSVCNTNPEPNRQYDPYQWLNYDTPANPYDWWFTENMTGKLDGPSVIADLGASNVSSDYGPMLAGGNVNWKNLEVLYSYYDEYNNYGGAANPLYNPVSFQDQGNDMGMEQYNNEFIFRPFTYGLDWIWQYQANVGTTVGTLPPYNTRYYVKTRLFTNPSSTDGACSNTTYTTVSTCQSNGGVWTAHTHIRLFISPSTPSDVDVTTGPYVEVTPAGNNTGGGGYVPAPAFTLSSGEIAFGGWNGGFAYEPIRVRKYTEPEPTCSLGTATSTNYSPVVTLSSPTLTPPLTTGGRPLMLTATLTPWAWTGNLTAVYADCLISDACNPTGFSGESQLEPGTISLWGSTNATTPKGFGDQLETAVAGTNNRAAINDSNWQADGRYIFTSNVDANGTITCTSPTTGDCLAFGISNLTTFENLFGTCSNPNYTTQATCTANGGTWTAMSSTDTQDLIEFVRGQYNSLYSRSAARNMCTSGTADTCQWKLGDIIHSNPLAVGIPNMQYADSNYSTWATNSTNATRDLVTYIGSNEGMLHAVRLSAWSGTAGKYISDTSATELWAYIPNAVVPMLASTTTTPQEYTVDGLYRALDITVGGVYKTVLVGGLRSGGQAIFAIDVTNPEAPNLLWEVNSITNPTQFANIGKSWSAPALGRLCESSPCDATSSSNRWVAIVGSGFAPNDITNLAKTAYLSVIDLATGTFIKQIQISTKPGNITTDIAVLRDVNGYIQEVYFGDYYGALWRVNLSTTGNVSTFEGKSIMDTGSYLLFQPVDYGTSSINTTGSAVPERPITAQPRVAYAGNNNYWVYFGTGVYDTYNASYTNQRFYGLYDVAGTTYTDAGLVNMTASSSTNPSSQSWYIELGHTDSSDVALTGTDSGSCLTACEAEPNSNVSDCTASCYTVTATTNNVNERVLTSPEVFGGYVFFSTFTPSNTPCGGGASRFYGVGYMTGGYTAGLMLNASTTQVRSITLATNSGVPSRPMLYSGANGQGQVVAAGLVDISTGQFTKVMLNSQDVNGTAVTILLWREVQ
jgi:Tfp pilus tip-associated adhesin PilY1